MKKEDGFTLSEILIASAIAVIILAGLIAIYIMSLQTWSEGSSDAYLERNGNLIMEQLIRGRRGRYGLREATTGSIVIDADGNGITFGVDKNNTPTATTWDDTTCRFYLSNNRVMYDPDTSVPGDEEAVNTKGNVENITFRRENNYIKIQLTMKEQISFSQRILTLDLNTYVFMRR